MLLPTAVLNQDDFDHSLPVLVRIYQLRSKEKFQQALFDTLWKKDKETLANDLLERKEVMIHPEIKTVVDIDLDIKHGAAFLGVMALFRKHRDGGWKQVVVADSCAVCLLTPKVKLVLDGSTMKLAN